MQNTLADLDALVATKLPLIFVDLPGAVVRRDIFSIHLKKRRLNPRLFDLQALANASEGFAGAEIEQAEL
jgi:ATP-dependent 26S proteasome regulatory subunit